MTLMQAINLADRQRPNAIRAETKLLWLEELDQRIWNEIYSLHVGLEDRAIRAPYELTTPVTLLAPPPYDAIYLYWLFSRIDFTNGENARYNSSALMYNTAWINLANYVNRNYPARDPGRVAGV